jgi:hypothetical protein
MIRFVVKGLVGATVTGALLIISPAIASAGTGGSQGPGTCAAAPGSAFVAPAAQEAGPNAGPNGFTWGPTRDGVPPVPGQAIIGVCLLGLD